MDQAKSLLEFLHSVADESGIDRDKIKPRIPELISNLGFDDYSIDSDAEGSIADAVVLPHLSEAPVIAVQCGYDPEAVDRGPYIPHRPSQVQYPTEDQILRRTSADYVISISNTTLTIRSESYARTLVLQEVDQSLDQIPTYARLSKENAEEIIREIHPKKNTKAT